MKALKIVLILILITATGLLVVNRGQDSISNDELQPLYTCSMHPQVISDKPGNCPICGMVLVPIHPPQKQTSISSSTISIDPITQQNMGIRTTTIIEGALKKSLRTVAIANYDETSVMEVTPKFLGWVERLYVNFTGQLVNEGDLLCAIYSPEVYSAQKELLIAMKSDDECLQQSATSKLKNFDVTPSQIDQIRSHGVRKTIDLVSPMSGYVISKNVLQGQMIEASTPLYRIANLSTIWLQAQIYEQDLPFVHLNQDAIITFPYLSNQNFSNAKFLGKINYIYPDVDRLTRTVNVRIELPNPHLQLKPGMYATVELESTLLDKAILIPSSSILRSGKQNIIFIALENGHFEPRKISIGARAANDMYQVLEGAYAGEQVVTSGQFMLDSESQLQEAINKMLHEKSPQQKELQQKELPQSMKHLQH